MNSKILSLAKNKLKNILKDKDTLDVILFGSAVKGKALPNDIDIAIITLKEVKLEIEGFHISILNPKNFFINPPALINTLLREGFSLKKGKPFAELYKFSSRVLYKYELSGLDASKKVKIVNILRGLKNTNGMVKEHEGEWIANQVFLLPVEHENIFERFFLNMGIKFKKFFILIH